MERIRKKLADPVRMKTQYGSVSDLVSALLYNWDHDQDTPLDQI